MGALRERDAAVLAATTAEIATLDDPHPFPPHVLARLGRLVGSHDVTYCDLARDGEHLSGAWWVDGVGEATLWDAPPRREDEVWWRLRHEHPLRAYRERTNDWTSARTISEFATQRQFRRTELWNALYRGIGVNYWLGVGLRPTARGTRMFVFTRERRDFAARDRLVLDLLQPHLQRRRERVQVATEAAAALAALEEQGPDEPRHVVLCSPGGTVEFATPRARRLLARYVGVANGRVPEAILRGDPVAAERDGRRLTIRSAPVGGLIVLLLGEEDLRLERLTPRQRDVLERLARGETDAEIGSALGIATATVSKHLEQIYERLGVHRRTAAAALVSPRP